MMDSSRGSPIRRASEGLLVAALILGAVAGRTQAQSGGGAMPVPAASPSARALPTCERCHGELEFLRQHTPTLARAESLSVSDGLLRGSGHDFACTRCH
ncbi:MAG TPA: hypothetical protein VF832_10990, partial [Longimicrobiales bacterium]